MQILPTASDFKADDDGAPTAPLSLWLRWVGPSTVLAIGIVCSTLAVFERPSPAAPIPLCGLAVLAPPGEAPFFTENDAAMARMMSGMAILPGGDVDHDFVEMMVAHHQGAIDMAQALLRYGHNEPLRRLAQEIVVTQQEEIAAMRLALGETLPPPAAAPDQVVGPRAAVREKSTPR